MNHTTVNNFNKPTDADSFDETPYNDNFDVLDAIVVPLGTVLPYVGTTDPGSTYYLLADGRPLARTGTYAALFSLISTTYGVGDGATTFNIPDLRSRVPVGSSSASGSAPSLAGGLTTRTRGATGGEEAHTLVTAEIPAVPQGTEGYIGAGSGFSGSANIQTGGSSYGIGQTGQTAVPAIAGGGGSHNNMQPWQAFAFIIRVR